jgi:peroxiredoxin family protein
MTDGKPAEKITLILFSGDLDKALACFILATTAASMGMQVSIFFTFWGLNVLKKKGAKGSSKGILQRMMGLMMPKGPRGLPLSKLNMLGLGPVMLGMIMRQKNIPSLAELIELAKKLGVKFIACTTSCGFMGIDRTDMIDDVDELAGAAAYLAEAVKSKINLFI